MSPPEWFRPREEQQESQHHVPEWPVPLSHTPPVTSVESDGFVGVLLRESFSDATIHCGNPMEVEQ